MKVERMFMAPQGHDDDSNRSDTQSGGSVRSVRSPNAPVEPAVKEGNSPKLPHERDQSLGTTADEPNERMRQAKADLDAGLVDTDLHGTPGQDAERREQIVKRGH